MYNAGDYIVYGQKGVCKVGDVTHLDMEMVNKDRLYYVLYPVNDERSKIYFPVDGNNSAMRKVMTDEEAKALLNEITDIEVLDTGDFKRQEEEYKKAVMGSDCRSLVRVIKTIYMKKQERTISGKKITATDARYLKQAEDKLYGELSFIFGKNRSDMEQFITDYIENK